LSSFAEAEASAARFDGLTARDLEHRLGLPRVVLFEQIGSTLDVAHALAADGAPAGTLVLADAQTAGRGRMGRPWRSDPGAGLWMTLIERPRDAAALSVFAVRVGLLLAPALERYVDATVGLKWPNDLYLGLRKLGGILVEARWRENVPEWVAIGVGINVKPPESEGRGIGLGDDVSRIDVLLDVVPAIRVAAARTGLLDESEVEAFALRDIAAGHRCREPVVGRVRGIDASAVLLVDVGSTIVEVRAGSLVLEEEM
jgi:BirA family biotin operon repressor/biotin-[acetyl-CoA-carboxylase] ligase